MRPTIALAALLTLALPAAHAADETPKIPADAAPRVTTASGLVYSVLTAGPEGKKPKDGDQVTVNYTGWLEDGKVFDASRQHGGPAEFTVGSLIPGWNEALTLMTPGSRWKIVVPAALGYGAVGAPPTIPGGATLTFELELLSFRVVPRFDFHAADTSKQTTTASGLKVEELKAGEGPKVSESDVIEVAYALWTTSGKLLQSSTPTPGRRAGPLIKIPVAKLQLAALKEAVLLMQVGTRLRIEAPPALAFGSQSQPDLPPNSTTIWELELLSIKTPMACPPFEKSAPGRAKRTESGLEIETLAEGTGRSPKLGEPVTVHYAGWLASDGTLFDSSFSRAEPSVFSVGQVIQGWNEALQQMKEGGKVRLTIPAGLAYGSMGSPPSIPPNATLIFYVELIKVGG